jgi:hypothetical protein
VLLIDQPIRVIDSRAARPQVDWYEAMADFAGERQQVYIFAMRRMPPGRMLKCQFSHGPDTCPENVAMLRPALP